VKRPTKYPDILNEARRLVKAGRFRDTRHAEERQSQRAIGRLEILFVINNGYHEKKKDQFDETWNAWNYAIRGKTLDKRALRVVVSIDEKSGLLIITAIDLAN
jgi:hypothetical protein